MLYANAHGLVTGVVMSTLLLYFFLSWGRMMQTRIGNRVEAMRPIAVIAGR